ncbi:uncharacterized protein LOC117224908 isoform X1 [Megalopta genalis]|uniref:uncharacterized protein LOC117224908 isoform X1 n=1 Tax=Megalopta genalis TaxID=115081 RepID=UPI003FD190D8
MSQSTAPHQPSETTELPNPGEKIAMSTSGNKGPGTGAKPLVQKNRTPGSVTPRNIFHKDPSGNTTDDASSSTKSHTNSARRSPAKMAVSPTAYKRPSSSTPAATAIKLEKQYQMKKDRFQRLKKDLIDKQKVAQDLFNEMSQLREKVIASGTKDPGKLDDLRIEVGSPKHHIPTENVLQEPAENIERKLDAIGVQFIQRLEEQLHKIPQKSRNLCRDILSKQAELIDFVASRLKSGNAYETEGDNPDSEMATKLETQQKDIDSLRIFLEGADAMDTKIIEETLADIRGLIAAYECEQAKLKESKKMEEQQELQSQLSKVLEELQSEKDKCHQGKERLRQVDSQCQKMKTKLREMETEGVTNEEKIQSLQASLKNLAAQMKQKEQSMETKLKEMQKTLKGSEALISKVEKQRDSFESRLFELKEKMTAKENETMNTIKNLSEKLDTVTWEVGQERQEKQKIEYEFNELAERYRQLEEKSNQLYDLTEKNKDFTITDGSHSENEVRLFNELQETKDELELQKQMVLELQQEKEEIVAVMHQAANRAEDQDSREKLAAELVFKTTELKNLMMQYTELKKIAKNAQEKNGMLEKQLIEIQSRLHSQTKEGGKAGLNAHAIELQQEVSDLRNNLAEVLQQKEELETALTQKQLELEQRDHVMREQSKFLKVRDELLELLKGKTEGENGEANTGENSEYIDQIALKTEAIQELYTTLKSKQMQVMRLEKMVKLMEDQQDHAQAQRTRLENRIAQLEIALQRTKDQRYVRNRLSLPLKSQTIDGQSHCSISDQSLSQHSSVSNCFPYRNPYDPAIKRSDTVLSTIASQTDVNQSYNDLKVVSWQSSIDEEPQYLCDRCRRMGSLIKDEQRSSKDSSNEDLSTLETRQYLNDDYHENFYYDPPVIKSRKFISAKSSPHTESASVYDSSRESYDPYITRGCQRLHAPRYYVRLLPTSRYPSRKEGL